MGTAGGSGAIQVVYLFGILWATEVLAGPSKLVPTIVPSKREYRMEGDSKMC